MLLIINSGRGFVPLSRGYLTSQTAEIKACCYRKSNDLVEGSCSCTIRADLLQVELFASRILSWAQFGAQGSWRSRDACRVPKVKEVWGCVGLGRGWASQKCPVGWVRVSFLIWFSRVSSSLCAGCQKPRLRGYFGIQQHQVLLQRCLERDLIKSTNKVWRAED